MKVSQEQSNQQSSGRPYTGPTGVRLADGRLHIDGYPDAKKLVELNSHVGHRLACLRRHQSALKFCQDAMQDFAATRNSHPLLAEAALIGIAARYFSCFGYNEASAPLVAERVFKGTPDARKCFEHWKAIRDSHFIHDQSDLLSLRTGIVFGPNLEVQDILLLLAGPNVARDAEHAQLLFNLIDHTLKHASDEIGAVLERAFGEARAMTADERDALPEISYVAPRPEDVNKIRRPRRP
jgi:hypothetical protein